MANYALVLDELIDLCSIAGLTEDAAKKVESDFRKLVELVHFTGNNKAIEFVIREKRMCKETAHVSITLIEAMIRYMDKKYFYMPKPESEQG